MDVHALPPDAIHGLYLGGTNALTALERRIGTATGDVAMELNQIAELGTIEAMERSATGSARFHLLTDARVPFGGQDERLHGVSDLQGGTYSVYGPDDSYWQHAKTFHFTDERGPETWIGNLAPIPKAHERTELSLVLGGDAAAAARAVTDQTLRNAPPQAVADAIDAAERYGVLFNDPLADRGAVSRGIAGVMDPMVRDDLLVVTKGIQHRESTSAIIDAHRSGRDVQVFVRDIAREDAERLAAAGVPAWQVEGALQPRVNAFFAGDRGVTSTAFLWGNMVGDRSIATSRDAGVLVSGSQGRAVRAAAVSTVRGMDRHTPIEELVRRGTLPETI